MPEIFWIVLSFALFAIAIYLFFKNREWKIKFEKEVEDFIEVREQGIRQDAIARSARTLSGKTLEKFVPFLEDFPYDPHDVRWLGDPVDLVVFDGYSKNKESGSGIKQIVFCEVKSGGSKLSEIQKKLRSLVEQKKVKWEEFRIGEDSKNNIE
jgi:predicted Holliday junction resolvase-like endonuclease